LEILLTVPAIIVDCFEFVGIATTGIHFDFVHALVCAKMRKS